MFDSTAAQLRVLCKMRYKMKSHLTTSNLITWSRVGVVKCKFTISEQMNDT